MVFILFHKGVQMLGKGILRNTYCDNRGLDNTIAIDAGASLINCRILFIMASLFVQQILILL